MDDARQRVVEQHKSGRAKPSLPLWSAVVLSSEQSRVVVGPRQRRFIVIIKSGGPVQLFSCISAAPVIQDKRRRRVATVTGSIPSHQEPR
jgi:hypothetical protein